MRGIIGALALLCSASIVQAHFVFVYISADGKEARLVFGHGSAPDPSTPASRVEKSTLVARNANGVDQKLTVVKGDGNFYKAALPADKCAVVFGTTEAGVTQRGDNPPMLSWYYPKVLVGDPFTKVNVIGTDIPLELIPERVGDKVRFRLLAEGKPVADLDVVVGLSDAGEENTETVKTDKEGWTTAFAKTGRYCVAARQTLEKPGEFAGKKYTAVRHIATLVFDFKGK